MMIDPINYFLPYQLDWINEPAPFAIAVKSRRIGFTHTQAFKAVQDRVHGGERPCDYWHSSADLTASTEFIQDCRTWAEVFNVGAQLVEAEEVIEDEKITTLQLRFSSGRKIVAGSSNPKFLRSKGGDVGLDEFAFHERGRELLKAAHASALFWRHNLRIWSSENGQGTAFAQIVDAARAGRLKASVHTVTVLDAIEQGIVEKILKLKSRDDKTRKEWLDDLRATCPDQETFDQEFLCIRSSDAMSLLNYDLIKGCEADLPLLQSPEELPSDGIFYAGYDVGRQRDLSVLWVLQKVGDVFVTRMVRELAKVDYTSQEGLLNVLMANRAVRRICIDSTGIGDMLAERSTQKWGSRAEKVHFTAPVKSDLAMPLLRLFQDKLIRIPESDLIREDLHKTRKSVTAAGNIRLDAGASDESGHADRFWALGLAYHAADAVRIHKPTIFMARKPLGF
jgi:phage FluMu gp28-like protein